LQHASEENEDSHLFVSYGFILYGPLSDFKRFKQQLAASGSSQLKYSLASSQPLWIEKKTKVERMQEEIEDLRSEIEELKRRWKVE